MNKVLVQTLNTTHWRYGGGWNPNQKNERQKEAYGAVSYTEVEGQHIWKSYSERLNEEPEMEIQREMDSKGGKETEGAKTMTHT